jgi:hypothetical protein
MPHFKKCIYVDDLLAITLFSCLAAIFLLTPPFNETLLKIPIALPLYFFIPGYAIICALFPEKYVINEIERFTLSVGLSLILTVFDGFLISRLPWGYSPAPIVISILGITTFFSLVALFRRKLLDENEQFSFSIKDFINDLKSGSFEKSIASANGSELDDTHSILIESTNSIPIESRRFHRSRSKVKTKGLKSQQPPADVKQKPLPPNTKRALIIALIGLIFVGSVSYAKITREPEILGDTEIPLFENGNMEALTGWEFTSNTNSIAGSYVNGSGMNSSNAYRIVNSFEGNLSTLPEYGNISQSIECKEDITLLLSAYVKSVSDSPSQGTVNQTKQITVNGKTVWSEGVIGNENWKHVEVPVDLQTGSNNFTFSLSQDPGIIWPVKVLWDNISLKLPDDIQNPTGDGILESIPPTSKVLELPNYTEGPSFTVSWNGTDSSGIAYYSIDSSTDGVYWETWIPRTTEGSSVFKGESDKTYYFRSRGVDNVGNEEPIHQNADTKTRIYIGAPVVKLEISPNPCKNATSFKVTNSIPLQTAVCKVKIDNFEQPDYVELKSTDFINWTGGYTIKHGNHFSVEASCTDINGNTMSAFDKFTVDNSLPDFLIEINPKTIDSGNLDIKVTPSVALQNTPSVSISGNKTVNVTYLSYSDGTYYYKAKIESDITEGEHNVDVSGTGLDSIGISESSKFKVKHTG